jgi:hypothetical protein
MPFAQLVPILCTVKDPYATSPMPFLPTGTPIGPKTTPLVYSLYGDLARTVNTTILGDRQDLVQILARVKEVLPDSLVLDRALPVSVSPAWKDASVHVFKATGAEGPVSFRAAFYARGPWHGVCLIKCLCAVLHSTVDSKGNWWYTSREHEDSSTASFRSLQQTRSADGRSHHVPSPV